MADTIRQQIITKIDTRLKTILITNGYETDIGANVFDWRAESLEEDDLPALIYRDVQCLTEISTLYPSFNNQMTVILLAVVTSDTPMTTIRKIIGDIDKAIGTDDRWDGLVLLTQRTGDESGVEIEEKKYAGCQMTMMVTFRTLGWNDYTVI